MQKRNWEERLREVYDLMQEMSRQSEPQQMVRAYTSRIGRLIPVSRRIALSRRGLEPPWYRVTRYSEWEDDVNPWLEKDRLPLLTGGLFAELIYSNKPMIIDELEASPDDPAYPYLEGQKSLMAIPMLDGGEALNMVVSTQIEPYGFDRQQFPDTFWMANLFGRATHNLVLKEEVARAYETIDRELKSVSAIQRSLLPKTTPQIPGLQLSAYYRTSQRAGGDYYDFFPLAEGKWGILIADVSGHGTPAAVVMAITHSIAHLFPDQTGSPGDLLEFVNRHLCRRYTVDIEAFVTAFYGIYDPEQRTLTYACAGHNPPRLWKCCRQEALQLDQAGGLPLGLLEKTTYEEASIDFDRGDRLILYTDGITEAQSPEGVEFGPDRLDEVINRSCRKSSDDVLRCILESLKRHTGDAAPADDRTLVVGTVD